MKLPVVMTEVYSLKQDAIDQLMGEIDVNREKYIQGESRDLLDEIDNNLIEQFNFENDIHPDTRLKLDHDNKYDSQKHQEIVIENAKIIYDSFKSLSPLDAFNHKGIWIYYAHLWGDYIAWRHDYINESDPNIELHFFANKKKSFSILSFLRDHEIYKHWVTMHTLNSSMDFKNSEFTIDEILSILYTNWHFVNRIHEFDSLFYNKNILLAISSALIRFDNADDIKKLNDRVFRGTNSGVNNNRTYAGFLRRVDARMSQVKFAVPEIYSQDELNDEIYSILIEALDNYEKYNSA